MGIYVGADSQVLFFYDSGNYAVPSGTSGNWPGLVQTHDNTSSVNYIEERFVGTNSRNVGQYINSTKDYDGTLSYHPQEWRLLGFAFGSIIDAGSPSPYTHTLIEANSDDQWVATSGTLNPFASITIQDVQRAASDGNHLVRTYKGATVDSISISATEGEPVTCEVNYKAQSVEVGSKTTDISNILDKDDTRPYIFSDVLIHLESGNTMDQVLDFTWTLNNNLATKHYLNGSKVAAAQIPENRDYGLDITLDATSERAKELYDQYFQGGSTFNTMLEITQTAGSEQVFIIMSGCNVTDMSTPTPAEGVIEYSATIRPANAIANVIDLKQFYNFGSVA